jgi:hypothetical protein
MMNARKEELKAILENLEQNELLRIWNEYSACDDQIFPMDEFDEIFSGYTPWEIARTCYYSGKFCPAHDYFWFNGYGNAESSDYPSDRIYIDDLADHILENNEDFDNEEIAEFLSENE